MNASQVTKPKSMPKIRILIRLFALLLLAGCLLIPVTTAYAQSPGDTDPAYGYSEWPDDEFFVAYPVQPSGAQRMSIYQPSGGLDTQTEEDTIVHAAANAHDAVAAVGGRFLTCEHDSVLYAFRHNTTQVGLKFFDPNTANPVTQLDSLADRIPGSTDYIALGAGDMDGVLAVDGEYREEAIVAWAKPSGDNKLPVSVAVLTFGDASEASPTPSSVTIALGSTTIDRESVVLKVVRPIDTAISLAVGDFNGDDVKEVAVAYISDKSRVTIDIFQYSVTVEGVDIIRTLTRVGSTNVTIGTYILNESVSLAAGNFDGDMEHGRDELALATSQHADPEHSVKLRMFDVTCTDGADCSTAPDMTIMQSGADSNLAATVTSYSPSAARKVQIVSGVFVLHPENPTRQQIAATYTNSLSPMRFGMVRIVDINSGLGITLGQESLPGVMGNELFWLTAGGFKGSRSTYDPLWSLVWSSWTSSGNYQHVYIHPATFPSAPGFYSVWQSPEVVSAPTSGGRAPIVAADVDGDSMYLGAPVHIVLYDVLSLDYILEEPPKHAFWDPDKAQVYSVSRNDDFNITLRDTSDTTFSTKTTDTSDWSIGGSASASASMTVKENFSTVIGGESAELTAGISGKVGYDYKEHESDYNSNSLQRTVTYGGSTNRDDYIVGRLQLINVWRYRLYGIVATEPGEEPFYEIVIPGNSLGLYGEDLSDPEVLYTDAGGLNFDWYRPTHENGNILSYPQYFAKPSDLGSYTIPCEPGSSGCVDGQKTVLGLMLPPMLKYCDGNSAPVSLTFSEASGSGEEHSSSHTMAENLAVKASFKSDVTVGTKRKGASLSTSVSAEAEFHNSNSWGSATTSDYKTSATTGITLNTSGCSAITAYGYYPVFYQATDGTIKATFAADPLVGNSGAEWWTDNYGQLPDLALNLPLRYYLYTNSQWNTKSWAPTASNTRKKTQSFFVRRNEMNMETGTYDEYAGAVTDGDTARLEVRVYNYSVTQFVTQTATVRFDAVAYDWTTNKETGARTTIGTTDLPLMAPREMVTVSIPWNTTGMSLGGSQMYRIYMVLDPNNIVNEKYEIESKATQYYFTIEQNNPAGGYWTSCADLSDADYAAKNCIDPAQNNEGYAYVTVTKTPTTGGQGKLLDADVSMDDGGLAAVDAEGNLVTGPVEVMQDEPLEIRITVHTDTPGTDYSNVLIFDGDPKQGGSIIAGKQIFVGAAGEAGSSVWFEWVSTKAGAHTLYAVVTETLSDAQPNNNTDTMDVNVLSQGSRLLCPAIFNP